MKERIEKLEAGHAAILAKLDGIASSIADGRLEDEKRSAAIESHLSVMDAKLEAKADAATLERTTGETRVALSDLRGVLVNKASATDVSALKSAVDKLPGTGAMITLVLGAVAFSLGGAAGLAFTLFKIFKPS